ncbi:MAG: hypothetical protein PVF37_00555 [Desulfobacterales bacterium]|jgi:hypothetical protein
MGRYNINIVDTEEGEEIFGDGSRRFDGRNADQPKQSPIRRKYKWQPEEVIKPKAKRNFKKIQHRLKYDWQEE